MHAHLHLLMLLRLFASNKYITLFTLGPAESTHFLIQLHHVVFSRLNMQGGYPSIICCGRRMLCANRRFAMRRLTTLPTGLKEDY